MTTARSKNNNYLFNEDDLTYLKKLLNRNYISNDIRKVCLNAKKVKPIEDYLIKIINDNLKNKEDIKYINYIVARDNDDKYTIFALSSYTVYIFSDVDKDNKLSFEDFIKHYKLHETAQTEFIKLKFYVKYSPCESDLEMNFMKLGTELIETINNIRYYVEKNKFKYLFFEMEENNIQIDSIMLLKY